MAKYFIPRASGKLISRASEFMVRLFKCKSSSILYWDVFNKQRRFYAAVIDPVRVATRCYTRSGTLWYTVQEFISETLETVLGSRNLLQQFPIKSRVCWIDLPSCIFNWLRFAAAVLWLRFYVSLLISVVYRNFCSRELDSSFAECGKT